MARFGELHVHVHIDSVQAQLDRIEAKVDAIRTTVRNIAIVEEQQMADLSALTAEVQENGDAVESAVTLLGNLSQQIRDLSTDPAALQALADELDANTQALASAVVANTPASTDTTTDTTTDTGAGDSVFPEGGAPADQGSV